MATPRFRMLSQALGAPEEGITYPLGVSPEEQPGLFEEASNAALARENARLKEGYVPAGTGPVVEPSLDSTLAPMPSGLRSRKPVDFTPDTTKMQGKLAGFLGGDRSLASPIPINTAPSGSDAAAPVSSTLPSSGPQNPAGKPNSDGAPNLPAPSSEGAGGDASERDLYLARLAAQSAAGFGGMGAGKNIDMGIADTLGERLKQVQALRAKREERAADVAQEQAQYEGANMATLTTQLAAFEKRPDIVAALQNLKPGAKYTKPSDFIKSVYQAVTNPPTVAGKEAGVEKTIEQTGVAREQKAAIPAKVEQGAGKLAETIRSNKAREEIQRKAILAKQLSDTKANNDVRAAGNDARAAEKAITDAMKSAEKKDLGIASNIRDFQGLEAVAPGFTRGKVPSWLGQGSIAAAIKVPGLNKQATQLASALELFTAGIRNSLFGASLTGNEKESFDAIVSSGILMPPDVLAANINRLREGAAKFAQNHFTVAQELHPEVTGRVLRASPLFGPATREGGVYADVWMLPAGPVVEVAGPASQKPPSARSIEELKKNPNTMARQEFDEFYGPGAAAKALGE